ncbi:MAG: hypothetical protein QOH35_1194 [Acidobacteriaceae bacterium]|jgi:hypothetical protein|nr:hypothetical protein [Acidobacteriaceae bacterium]
MVEVDKANERQGVSFESGYAETPLPPVCIPPCLVVPRTNSHSSFSYKPGNNYRFATTSSPATTSEGRKPPIGDSLLPQR